MYSTSPRVSCKVLATKSWQNCAEVLKRFFSFFECVELSE